MLTKFADVVSLSSTRTADPASAGIDRFVGLEHIQPENLHIRSWGNVADGTTFTSTFKSGQVLFGKRRAYQRKVAVADFDGVCSSDIYVFESKDPQVLLPELVPFILQSEGFYEYAVKTSAGSLSPRTNWTHLANYEFPLPPVDEQRRIADLLWAQTEVIESLRQAIFSRNILERSARTHFFSKGLNDSGTIHHNVLGDFPENWRVVKITELVNSHYGIVDGPFGSNLKTVHYRKFGHPVIQSAFVASGYFNPTATEYVYVDDEKFEEQKRSKVAPNDIVMVKIGINCGACALLPESHPVGVLAGNCLKITPNPDVCDTKYLLHYLHWLFDVGILERLVNSTQQRAMSIGRLKTQDIAIPALAEQKEIAKILDEIDSAKTSFETHLENTKNLFKKTLNSVL